MQTYKDIYKEDGLSGGLVIMIGADPLSKSAAMEALLSSYYVFNNGQMELQRLKELAHVVGKRRLVLDLSCRKKMWEQSFCYKCGGNGLVVDCASNVEFGSALALTYTKLDFFTREKKSAKGQCQLAFPLGCPSGGISKLSQNGSRVYFQGKVKQIVGSAIQALKEGSSTPVTNFESDKSASEYANMYKEDGLTGGHVIMIGADPLSKSAAMEALHAHPGGLHVGGGINPDNALSCIEEGASHVIITSNVFNNGQLELQRLEELACVVGKQRLVLDLSCRKKEGKYAIVTDRWRKFTYVFLDEKIMDFLATYADEFLVHGVDVEGKRYWCEESGKLRERNDVAFEVLAERKKRTSCPHCHHCVEHVDGCSIVKCRCGSSFCYKCGRRKVHRQPLYLPL
ncbi:hypothetical protein RHSIM_RhsimUnG0066500 [Rhododendron simsii]|uniref:1-(5-phosphoribosyl)-5-[(5-phosphoribosylamino)methylideneamino] imidazole-4-carboxamide isomerase HISN3, chloroplastic n=1 Tax=Rhododendron simsii TaxID=118357 RepID=A0A834L5B4_RHOSS|nr:hypothetical protein RHSIM_RhsimUnG0066500 [Rhododendron simsii]